MFGFPKAGSQFSSQWQSTPYSSSPETIPAGGNIERIHRFGISEPTADKTYRNMLLLNSWSKVSREVSAHMECLVHNQTVKVAHQHKVLCRPKQLLPPDCRIGMPHSHLEYDTDSDSHASTKAGLQADIVIRPEGLVGILS